jgi:hypothetical protein
MTIQLVVALRIAGAVQAAGTQVTLSEALEADLIYQGKATRVGAAPNQSGLGVVVSANTDPLTGGITVNGSIDVDVRAYGVVADGALITGFQVDGTGNVGAVTATADTFTAADVGKRIVFHKPFAAATMANYSMYRGLITSVEGPRNCTISCTSCPDLGAGSYAVFGTDNSDAINTAVNVLELATAKGVLQFPTGMVLAYPFRSVRVNGATYSKDDYVTRNTANGFYYKCISGGVAGGAEPTYVDTFGSTFNDGGVTWQCMGRTTLVLPGGGVLRGRGKQRGVPYGFLTTGSTLVGCGYDATYGLLHIPTGTPGCQVEDIAIDACRGYPYAVEVSGSSSVFKNITAMGGVGSTFKNGIGSTETIGCTIVGRLVDNAHSLDTTGDAQHFGGFISGAGNGGASVFCRNITDDCKIIGVHMYKGGWANLDTLQGPNLRIESTTAAVGGGNIVGNTFDSSYGAQIELYVHGASAGGIQALTIANNQFYQPIATFPTNTYPVIKIEATATAPAVSYAALSITGNVAKGTSAGNQYSAFVNYTLNAGTQVVADVNVGNAVNNCAALYTGTAHTQSYTAGNAWRTTAGVTTVG